MRPETDRRLGLAAEPQSGFPEGERRTRRTRAAILNAFRHLILSEGYASITPTRLAAVADVGRSTFYEHFANVDEVLAFSIGRILAPLAVSAMRPQMDRTSVATLQHVWDNRKMTKALLKGAGRPVVLRLLTEQFETSVAARRLHGGAGSRTDARLSAAYLGAGTLAVLDGWVSGQVSGSAAEIANILHAMAYASVGALEAGSDAATEGGQRL